MNPKIITAALAATVVCFSGIGVMTVKTVSENIEASDMEFARANNTLSPLFDLYGLAIVDGQAKVSRGLIAPKDFCHSIHKLSDEAQKLIAELGNPPELVAQHGVVNAYLKKVSDVCNSGKIEVLNSTEMTKELYAAIEPMTELINKHLEESLTISRQHKDTANRSIVTFERFASIAAGLGIVFAVAPWIGKRAKPDKEPAKKKKRRS